ncbi:MAG TPA: ATP-binding protein [Vicinamibacterales bacterium]|nr:ATP-binding protein [Vicinamibacterales bacterium]
MTGDLRGQVGWLIVIRAMIGTLLLGGAAVAQVTSPDSFAVHPFFWLIAITYGLTIVWAATLRHVDRARWIIDAQLACDAVIVSSYIFLTGGVTSFFSSLYALPIIAASVIQFRRGGLMVATLSGVLYIGIVLSQYMPPGIAPGLWGAARSGALPGLATAQYVVLLNLFAFFAVALLSGSMAESVRSAGVRLERASNELADLQALNQNVIDSLPSGLVTTDPAQHVLTFNHAAERICGFPAFQAIGRPVAEVLQLPAEVTEAFNRGLGPTGARRLEFKFHRADGPPIDIGLSATHVDTPNGSAGFLITFQDLTDVKKLERDARLQQRLAAVGEMAAGIAHEIRNPLASMSGSIQILRDDLPLNAEQEQLMDIVLRESDRLNTTIKSFLQYARPHRSAMARFDVRRVLQDAALLLRNSADVHDSHTVDVVVPPEPIWLEADEGQVKQIVWNLATNGLRAMPEGGRLRLGAAVDAHGVAMTVQDEGIGIPPEAIEGLFQPFRGSFARGSGLGLAIVHRIVTDYQGSIKVDSAPGLGTTVSVRLPARAEVTT